MNMEEAQNRWIWKVESNFSSKSCFDSLKEDEDESACARSNAKRQHLGGGGGLKWPSRSYCCNFCTREFRSAQALGGHMNVHRIDKARLKLHNQSPICLHRSAEKQHRTDLCVGSKKPSTDDEVALALQLLNKPASFISEHGFEAGTRTEDLDLELRL